VLGSIDVIGNPYIRVGISFNASGHVVSLRRVTLTLTTE
jgi:hypothetical protein